MQYVRSPGNKLDFVWHQATDKEKLGNCQSTIINSSDFQSEAFLDKPNNQDRLFSVYAKSEKNDINWHFKGLYVMQSSHLFTIQVKNLKILFNLIKIIILGKD